MIRHEGLKTLHPDNILLDSCEDSHGGVNRFGLILVGDLWSMIAYKFLLLVT